MTEQDVWWRPNETSNSVGNLVMHLTGSINHYLNKILGGMDYRRDRDGEFAARGTLSKELLLAEFDAMVTRADETFATLTAEQMSKPATDPRYAIAFEELLAIALHFSTHAGQIVWIAKMMRDGALNEVWMRTHEQLGAFKAGS